MIKEINILGKHGWQYIPDLEDVTLPETFRGRPVISDAITNEEAVRLKECCPVYAIETSPVFSIHLGKCLFCGECSHVCPDRIRFTNDFRMAVTREEHLVIKAGSAEPVYPDVLAIRPEIRRLFRHSLKLRQVSAGGDNSTEMELNAAGNVNFDMGRFGISFVAAPRHADGIVLTGPVTANMAHALRMTWEAIAEPKILVLAGTDAISGGLFLKNTAIDRSFLSSIKPDLYLPGNPVHPLTVIHGLTALMGVRIRGGIPRK
ncbi:MAG TPA: NADH:ubiquinone oxidoreductase [Bacteroidales bacterium]|nr:NADH:ubiquinone oxidoreductase [Bacteroidales bacterium]HSA43051.1 NADH:ubiquinone oxidoreductase [Bacteroidales bacterium]